MTAADIFTLLGGWVFPIIGIVIAGLLALRPKKGDLEHRLIDQLQERIEEQESRHERLESKVDALRVEIRIRDDYILVLRHAIDNRHEPPPPPWPEGLL
ncbi:hypothetical protein [Microbacterium excoecariae]|uniref:hypothetical protein n=1 Tax=Microbacterium excoecariae TaxID=2715210 RepID=UPI00140DA793|nr:hypothetical protein [Microbacterium excoecariae]NHI16878.1 hypothetical protein [Microbacterium excoecariae]